uniref:Aspartyl protease n=1 Tax=Candidatus Kentrum eta TaxID=2126337 RepID=A0A450UMK2_9GAMM|nr:MAG: hypothetical protein BECKH772A_GA0070896_100613 [Candidatus Kentron sp. H]VFJ94468.1 MAG: hypothetical protein BECKH772B_GA0070898_100623 [Candidatus Kentron sp. H]VFK00963.1 MAG: hypothetical protein BECKH772C_GA0070978_100563 [Candidatus Kentron sp. H]
MGRITVPVKITNLFEEDKTIQCNMLVDTGAGALILPMAWKDRLGECKRSEPVELLMANGDIIRGETCWPVEIEIEGFRPISNEAIFVDMDGERRDGAQPDGQGRKEAEIHQPLLGYVILEQALAAVDMLNHRLVPVKYIDMK